MLEARPAPTALAFNGMVATPHPLATGAGLAALRDGGSAADAVVAANAVLTVLYPDQTAIGGDVFLLYHDAAESPAGKLHALNGSGRAPAAASRAALRAAGHAAMPARGIHAVTVPGTVDAWDAALTRFGRLGLERCLQPAIALARDGFPVSAALAARLDRAAPVLDAFPDLRTLFAPEGHAPRTGDRLRLPALAATLEHIAHDGRDAFYAGPIAAAIIAASDRLDGAFTLADLADHHAEWVEPLFIDYRGVGVAGFPPNSQGLTALLALNLVEVSTPAAWGTPDHLHPLIEAKKLAFAVRDRLVADPAFAPFDAAKVVGKPFAADLWRAYDHDRAAPGTPDGAGDTVYLCAVDRDGNAASLIQSLYMSFGSGVVAGDTGVVLHNRGAAFSLDDDHPNRLDGGKRPRHTLMPSMLYRDGALLGPLGTQGGDAQAQVTLQLITGLVDHHLEPQAAVDAPRWVAGGTAADPSTLVSFEARFPNAAMAGLAARGHVVRRVGAWDTGFGHAQMILRDPDTGLLRGAADPRADGLALGY